MLRFVHTLLSFLAVIIFNLSSYAQDIGAFRTKASGNWGDHNTWEIFDGLIWNDAVIGQFPGGTSEADANTVYLEAGFSVNLQTNQSCKDLYLNTTADVIRINTGNNTLDVWGKMSFYQGTTPVYSPRGPITSSGILGWITTGESGSIRFRGTADRTIMYQKEVNANNSNSGWNLDFAFDPGFTGEINDRLRAGSITVSSGILHNNNPTGELRIGTNNGGSDLTNNGRFIIKSGATVRGGAGIFKKGTVAAESIILETGSNLIINNTGYILAAANLVLDGTVTLENTIDLPSPSGRTGASPVNTFNNLMLVGTGAKTLQNNVTVNGTLGMGGTSSLSLNSFILNYGEAGTLEYNGLAIQVSSSSEFPSSAGPANLVVNNPNGISLHESRTISNQLTLVSGLLSLNNVNLTLGASSPAVAGTPSENNMIVTNGTGKLSKVFNAPGAFLFPLGDNSDTIDYSPSLITVNSADLLDGATYFALSAKDGFHPAVERVTDKVSRYWEVSTNMTGYSYDGMFQYLTKDVQGTEANINSFLFSNETAHPSRTLLEDANTSLHQLMANDFTGTGFVSGANYVCSISDNSIQVGSGVTDYCDAAESIFLHGSVAVVTSGSPSYQWQKKINEGSWTTIVENGSSKDYTEGPLAAGTYRYRRTVLDTAFCFPAEENISNELTITVNPSITGNTISNFGNQEIYITYGEPIPTFNTTDIIEGGNGSYVFRWFRSPWAGSLGTSIYFAEAEELFVLDTNKLQSTTYFTREVKSGGCTSISNEATVVVFCSVSEVVNDTVCQEGNASFSVTGGGKGLSYQWQVSTNGGATFQDLSNEYPYAGAFSPDTNSLYSGFTTSTLTINDVPSSFNGYKYRCKVDGACNEVYSNSASLIVYPLVSITSQPLSKTICEGNNTTLTFTATGGLTYQWQVSTDGGTVFDTITNEGVYSNATSAILGITGVTASMNNYKYRCIVSGACNSEFAGIATLSVNTLASILSNPSNVTTCNNANTSFTVSATGTGIAYQWEVSSNGGASYSAVVDGGIYSNATTSTLNITEVPSSVNNFRYRCKLTGCTIIYTTAARLTLDSPFITSNPVNRTICEGGGTTYGVVATGPGINYQWQESTDGGSSFGSLVNGGVYSNATTATLSITGAPISMNSNRYRCIVIGSCSPSTISAEVNLTVNPGVSIVSNPSDVTTCNNANTSFTVSATGTGIAYQWEVSSNGGASYSAVVDGGIYSNATTSTLNITEVPSSVNNFRYRCKLTGCSIIYTTAARLTLNSPTITGNPVNRTICEGGNTTFGVVATGPGIAYQWQESTDGGSSFNDLLNGSVYSNATTATLSIMGAPISMNNNRYRCIVSGSCSPAATSTQVTLSINPGVAIVSNPSNVTTCNNANTSFTVSATGTGIAYQWEVSSNGSSYSAVVDGGIYSNASTSTLSITGVPSSVNNFRYRCKLTGCTIIYTTAARLTLDSPFITSNPVNRTICEGGGTTYGVVATGPGIVYQWQESTDGGSSFGNLVNGGVYSNATTATLSIMGAPISMNSNRYRCIVTGSCSPAATSTEVTLSINPGVSIVSNPSDVTTCNNANTSFTVSATGTGIAYQWEVSSNGGASYSAVVDGGIYSNTSTSTLNITGVPTSINNFRYRCKLTRCSIIYTTAARLTLSAPAITNNPVSRTVCEGGNTTFGVVATGPGIVYQWQESTDGGSSFNNLVNGGVYNNATAATLSIIGASAAMNSNRYRCIVTGSCSAPILSATVTLILVAPPTVLANPVDGIVCENSDVNFVISASGSNLSYQWEVSTNGGAGYSNLTNNTVYSNVTTPVLTLTSVPSSYTNYRYRCRLIGCSIKYSSYARLTVNTGCAARFSANIQESQIDVEAYPNPFTDEVSILSKGFEGPVTVIVKDMDGKTVFTKADHASHEVLVLGRELSPGIYMVQMYNDKEVKTLKVVKTE